MSVFHRIAVGSPDIHPGDIAWNASQILLQYQAASERNAAVLVTPELSLTGSSCGDLFFQDSFLKAAEDAVYSMAESVPRSATVLLVGTPVKVLNRVFAGTAIIQNGEIKGVMLKKSIASCRKNNGWRAFSDKSQGELPVPLDWNGAPVGFEDDAVFESDDGLVLGIVTGSEENEAFAPSDLLAASRANVIACLSSGIEEIGGCEQRRQIALAASSKLTCVYAMACSGTGESTSDGVYGGHLLIADSGRVLAEKQELDWAAKPENSVLYGEINCCWLNFLRRKKSGLLYLGKMGDAPAVVHLDRTLNLEYDFAWMKNTTADIFRLPFVENCGRFPGAFSRIIRLAAIGLAKRVAHTLSKRLVLGVSGGLDSTLALLVCHECCRILEKPSSFVLAITMPGMGTTDRTKNNAAEMAELLGAELRTISIRQSVLQHFSDIGHCPENTNVVYENAQARERTQILMDVANEENGLVVGTGDMSEIALGWSTFNGDHMSMYCVNCGVPKTLIRAVIEDYASRCGNEALAAVLRDVNATPVSPELLPGTQQTESILGSYELHDFYLYYFMKYGLEAKDILELAREVFKDDFPEDEIKRTLSLFMKRFFTQQFKRNAAPEGPKVLEIAMSAKNDWVMPADMAADLWKKLNL